MGNVDTSSKSDGKVLKWDGSEWVVGDDLQGGGAGSVSSTTILDGTIVDADIASNAQIAQSKVEDLTGDLDSLESDVGDILSRVTGLDSSVSTLNTQVSGLDTDDVSEAGNKYYTASRVRSDLIQTTIDTSTTKAVTSKAIKDALAGKQDALNLGYRLPASDGTSGQILATDGSGVLSWTTPTVTIADGSVTTSKLASRAVTDAKIASFSASKLTGNLNANILANQGIPQNKIGSGSMGVNLAMNNNRVTGLPNPTSSTEAVHKKYVDDKVGALQGTDMQIVKKSASYTITNSDGNNLFLVDGTSDQVRALTLPKAQTVGSGFSVTVKKLADEHAIQVRAADADRIDGQEMQRLILAL